MTPWRCRPGRAATTCAARAQPHRGRAGARTPASSCGLSTSTRCSSPAISVSELSGSSASSVRRRLTRLELRAEHANEAVDLVGQRAQLGLRDGLVLEHRPYPFEQFEIGASRPSRQLATSAPDPGVRVAASARRRAAAARRGRRRRASPARARSARSRAARPRRRAASPAEPSYSSSSGGCPRTFASGPSTARITSAIEISSAGRASSVAALLARGGSRRSRRGAGRARMFSRKLSGIPCACAICSAVTMLAGGGELDRRADGVVGFCGGAHAPDYARRRVRASITGGCLCGGVRYEITEPLAQVDVLPLHALPAAHRHGGLAAGAASRRARSGSSQGEELVQGLAAARRRLREVLLLELRRRALQPASRRRRSGASAWARSTPIPGLAAVAPAVRRLRRDRGSRSPTTASRTTAEGAPLLLERNEPRARRLERRVGDAAARELEPLDGRRRHLGRHRADAHADAVADLERPSRPRRAGRSAPSRASARARRAISHG